MTYAFIFPGQGSQYVGMGKNLITDFANSKHVFEQLDDELNRRAWRDTLARFTLRPAALDTARYKRFSSFLLKQKLISKIVPIDDYAVQLKYLD